MAGRGIRRVDGRRERLLAEHWAERWSTVVDLLRRYRGGILVDVGCGQGKDVPPYAEGFDWYVGIDREARASWRGRASPSRAFLVGDAGHLPLRPGAADAVMALWLAEHLRSPGAFFREAARILRPRGGLVLLTPNRWNYNGFLTSLVPRAAKRALKRLLLGEDEEHATYYRSNTVRAIDTFAGPFGLVRRDLRMLTFPGYTFPFPLGGRGFEVERRVMERLPTVRPGIAAAYEKADAP